MDIDFFYDPWYMVWLGLHSMAGYAWMVQGGASQLQVGL